MRAFDVFDLAFGQGYSFVLAGQRLEIAPERNHQFARQCNNSDAPDASLGDAGALDGSATNRTAL